MRKTQYDDPPWKCGSCEEKWPDEPFGATTCSGCEAGICEGCTVTCALNMEPLCENCAVSYEGKPHCATCRDHLQAEAAHEKVVEDIRSAPPELRQALALGWALARVMGGA